MVSAPFAAIAALFMALGTIELFPFLLELQPRLGSASTSTPAGSVFDSAVVLPLAAMVTLFIGVVFIYLHHAAAAAAAGNRRLSELVPFVLCGAVGILEFYFFVQPAAAGVVLDDVGALSRAIARAAVDALPASAAVVFFLGITLVIAHIRAGGEGGGGAVADDQNQRVPVPVNVLKGIVIAAAAALLGQIAIALYLK